MCFIKITSLKVIFQISTGKCSKIIKSSYHTKPQTKECGAGMLSYSKSISCATINQSEKVGRIFKRSIAYYNVVLRYSFLLKATIKQNSIKIYSIIPPTTSAPPKSFYCLPSNKSWIKPKTITVYKPHKCESIYATSKLLWVSSTPTPISTVPILRRKVRRLCQRLSFHPWQFGCEIWRCCHWCPFPPWLLRCEIQQFCRKSPSIKLLILKRIGKFIIIIIQDSIPFLLKFIYYFMIILRKVESILQLLLYNFPILQIDSVQFEAPFKIQVPQRIKLISKDKIRCDTR